MIPPRIPSFVRRLWRLVEAERALFAGAPERALGALRDPVLALSPKADLLRERALDVLFRDAAQKAREGRDASVARLLGVAAGEDPTRAASWRRHFEAFPPPDEGAGSSRGRALRDLLARLRDAGGPTDSAPRALPAGRGGPPRLAPLEPGSGSLRFRLAVDDGGDLLVVAASSLILGHARAGVADIPLLADLESRHARLTYGESFHAGPIWRLEGLADAPVRVEGREVLGARSLNDGDRVRLAANLEFRFSRPDPASATAVLELLHGAEAEGAQRVLLFVPGPTGRVRIGARTNRHVPVNGIEHEIELSLERAPDRAELLVRCAGGVRSLGAGGLAAASTEERVALPPRVRVDLVLGARPTQRAPYGLSLLPLDRSRMSSGLV